MDLNIKVELKRFSNADMYLFSEKDMGGVVSCISKNYSKGNHKYLKSHDSKQDLKYIYTLSREYIMWLCGFKLPNFFQQTDSNV